ncbi:hypothetical protein IP69_15235 [Bosea sp. AAP35]|nr:hypothetical protein IP69_15235 [Bosea sp. AAP35]
MFGFDLPTAQKWVIAFGVILVLLVLLGLFARQIKDGRLRLKGQGGGRTRQPRLGVVDIHDLDRQRQLILIRRDNVEHLVMIGGASDVVIETNILRSGARTPMQASPDIGLPDRPLPFDTLVPQDAPRQEPPRQEPLRQESSRQEPSRQDNAEDMRRAPPAPVAQVPMAGEAPPPPVRSAPRPMQTLTQAEAAVAAAAGGSAVLAASSRAQPAPAAPASSMPTPNFTRDHAPAPTASAGELDDMARQLDEALKRPFSAVRPSQAQANLPVETESAVKLDLPAPPVAPPTRLDPVAASTMSAPPVSAPPMSPPLMSPPPIPASPPAARIVPLDVEAELELALGLKPERTSPKPPAPAPLPVVSHRPADVEPVVMREAEAAAAPAVFKPAAAPVAEPPVPLSDGGDIRRIGDEAALTAPTPADAPADDDGASGEPFQEFEPVADASPAPPPASEPDPATQPEHEAESAPKPIDPFSVDAIEAEFARLLGRDPKPRP